MALKQSFNAQSLKTKGLTLLIEHSPCCILSFAAGMAGISILDHNPLLELGFAIGGAIAGEHIGHKLFHRHHEGEAGHGRLRRYGIALAFGLASWGLHQAFLHDHDHNGENKHHAVSSAIPAASMI